MKVVLRVISLFYAWYFAVDVEFLPTGEKYKAIKEAIKVYKTEYAAKFKALHGFVTNPIHAAKRHALTEACKILVNNQITFLVERKRVDNLELIVQFPDRHQLLFFNEARLYPSVCNMLGNTAS